MSSPKGTIRLHPEPKNIEKLSKELYRYAKSQVVVLKLTEQQQEELETKQEWGVFPKVPSSSPKFVPISVHKTKDQAYSEKDKLDAEGTLVKTASAWLQPEDAAKLALMNRINFKKNLKEVEQDV